MGRFEDRINGRSKIRINDQDPIKESPPHPEREVSSGAPGTKRPTQLSLAEWFSGGQARLLIVFAILHVTVVFPGEYDSFAIHNLEAAGNETGIAKFLLCDLAEAVARAQIRFPGNGARGHVVVTRDFQSLHILAILDDANAFFVMARIVANPFPREIDSLLLFNQCIHTTSKNLLVNGCSRTSSKRPCLTTSPSSSSSPCVMLCGKSPT